MLTLVLLCAAALLGIVLVLSLHRPRPAAPLEKRVLALTLLAERPGETPLFRSRR
ncbi:MAG: hypothetical protein U0229_10625 [Anaeromyxobacter sp.]|mgnify:CR=1 FL=1